MIGNPPYLSYGGRQSVEIPQEVRDYYSRTYESAGWPTAHSLFLERSIKLLSRRCVSFIVPDQVGHLGGYSSLRAIASRETGITEVCYWGEHVFRGVITPALTMVLDKSRRGEETTIFSKDASQQRGVITGDQTWNFSPAADLIQRMRAKSFSLGKLVGDCGIRTTAAKEQVVPLPEAKGKFVPALEGKVVNRYSCDPPEIAVKLNTKKEVFIAREERYQRAKFLIRQTASYPIVGPHEHVPHFRNSLLALYEPEDGLDIRYVVALLNSKLLRFIYTETIREAQQRTFPQVKVGALQSLPIRCINLSNKSDRRAHDQLVELVTKALEARQRLRAEKNPIRRETLQRNFELIDAQIERAVYALYGAAASDIEFVESIIAGAESAKEKRPKCPKKPKVVALPTNNAMTVDVRPGTPSRNPGAEWEQPWWNRRP